MGGFHLARTPSDDALAAARAQFDRHGFTRYERLDCPPFHGFHAEPIHGGLATFYRQGDDFVAVAGTLVFDGMLGEPALARLLGAFSFPYGDWDRLRGQFALLVRKAGRTYLLTDFFGAFQLFHTGDDSLFSTSFLAAAGAQERLNFDPQGVYEFAFNVFPTGNDTVLKEVRRLGSRMQIALGEKVERQPVEKLLPARIDDAPMERRAKGTADILRGVVAPYAAHYGDRMQCPLSGGLDSRLALGLLREASVAPHIYVYGSPGDPDVEIARRIASGEGIHLEIFRKAEHRAISPDEFPEIVERNFHETDALVTDGGLFDNGGNAAARHDRQRGGQLAVSGGCGEVMRNFFYLPDRAMTARALVETFFARFSSGDVANGFDADRFLGNLEAKALAAIGRPGDAAPLRRPLIEQLYPRMRCRAFFGREISLVGRQGGYLMPFFDQVLVGDALGIPIAQKNAGRYESAVLRNIDPRLAAYPSSYGYPFTEAPTPGHRWSEFSTRARPVWMRKRSYALRRRLGAVEDEHGGLLTPAFLGRVLDLHFPHMSRFFRMPNIADSGLYRRIATLEYLGRHFEDRMV